MSAAPAARRFGLVALISVLPVLLGGAQNASAATPATTSSAFRPLQPARLADTRPTGTTVDGRSQRIGRRNAGTTLAVPVVGRGQVPATQVGTVVVNVTAANPSSTGYLVVYSCGTARPHVATLNFDARRTSQTIAIVPPGTNGAVCIYTSAATDLVVDVTSWTRTGSSVVPVAPARLADTRPTGRTIDGVAQRGGRRVGGTTLAVPVLGRAKVPAIGVGTVVLNVIAASPSAAGRLTVYPCGTTRPSLPSVTFHAGSTTQNLVFVRPGSNGKVCVHTSATTHVVVDISDWTATTSGIALVPPARLNDTTSTGMTVEAGAVSYVGVSGRARVPTSDVGTVILDITAVAPAASGYLTAYPCDAPRPRAASTTYVRGTTTQSTVIASPGAYGTLCIYSSARTDIVVDVKGWGVAAAPVRAWATIALPPGSLFSGGLYDGGSVASPSPSLLWRYSATRLRMALVDPREYTVTVRTYDASTFRQVGAATVLSFANWGIFGGMYAAPNGDFFLAVGRNNLSENDNLNVIEVRRYDSGLHLLGSAHITGGATQGIKGIYVPFAATAADMLLVGNRLVVHSARLLYLSPDGLHHQVNFTFEVNINTLVASSFSDLGAGSGYSYSSHSFRQLVTMAGGALVVADHGDAFPRSIVAGVMADYPTQRAVTRYDLFPFNGAIGDNFTGATMTDIAAFTSHVVIAGNSIKHPNAPNGALGSGLESRNIYVTMLDTITGAHSVKWLTAYSAAGTTSAEEPRMVQVAPDRFALLYGVRTTATSWTEYRLIDHTGRLLAATTFRGIRFRPAGKPLVADGRLYWLDLQPEYGSTRGLMYALDVRTPTAPVLVS